MDYIALQKFNSMKICETIPVDVRKIKLTKNNNIILEKYPKKLDMYCFFTPSCPHCISMFVTNHKYIYHFSKNHKEVPLIENVNDFIKYYDETIEKMIIQKITIPLHPTEIFKKDPFPVILKPIKTFITIISPHPKDNKFSKGTFHNLCIDIKNDDGYVRANSIRENFKNLTEKEGLIDVWQRNQKVQELLTSYSKQLNLPYEKLIIKFFDTNLNLRGIYLHPKIIIEYIFWLSTDFKIFTQNITTDYLTKI